MSCEEHASGTKWLSGPRRGDLLLAQTVRKLRRVTIADSRDRAATCRHLLIVEPGEGR